MVREGTRNRKVVLRSELCRETFFDLTLPSAMPFRRFRIMCAGVSELYHGYLFERFKPIWTLVRFTADGSSELTVSGRAVIQTPGTVTVVPAGAYAKEVVKEEAWKVAWFLVDDTSVLGTSAKGTVTDSTHCDAIFRGHTDYAKEVSSGEAESGEAARYIAHLLEVYYHRVFGKPENKLPVSVREYLVRLDSLIESDPAEKWTIDKLAKKLCISSSYLKKICRQYRGSGVMELARDQRMRRATLLLSQTNWSLSRICVEVGYNDQAAFSDAFKRVMNLTPHRWRRDNRYV